MSTPAAGPSRWDGSDLVLELRVQPRAARSELAGLRAGRLLVRLQAPPVDGRANVALVELLAQACGVPRSAVVIEQGLAGRDKRVRVRRPVVVPGRLAAPPAAHAAPRGL